MKFARFFTAILCFFIVLCTHAEPAKETIAADKPEAKVSAWQLSPEVDRFSIAFMGMATAENGEQYTYYLRLKQHEKQLTAEAVLTDSHNGVLIHENQTAEATGGKDYQWQVGTVFLRFNPITDNWVFGVKKKGQNSFNFKVDLLAQADKAAAKKETLRKGIEMYTAQTSRLNGHISLKDNETEIFVTAKQSWFQQFWLSAAQKQQHTIESLLCEMKNGAGFYFVRLPESDTAQATVAGWRDSTGKAQRMSQFVTVKYRAKTEQWQIAITSPAHRFLFTDLIKTNPSQFMLGEISEEKEKGVCALSHVDFAGN